MNTVIVFREKGRKIRQPEVFQEEQVNTEDQTEVLMGEIVRGIMNKVDERLQSISASHSPQVANQSLASEHSERYNQENLIVNSQHTLGGGGTQLVHCTPRISFSCGEEPPNKNEKTYEQWIFDVKTFRPSYPEGLLKEAIFGSLKGNAVDIARGLGPDTTVIRC